MSMYSVPWILVTTPGNAVTTELRNITELVRTEGWFNFCPIIYIVGCVCVHFHDHVFIKPS